MYFLGFGPLKKGSLRQTDGKFIFAGEKFDPKLVGDTQLADLKKKKLVSKNKPVYVPQTAGEKIAMLQKENADLKAKQKKKKADEDTNQENGDSK